MKRTIIALLATSSITGAAMAASLNDQIVESLQSRGFGHIEIKNGPSQTKVEATGGGTKLELVYDNASGEILKQEQERVRVREGEPTREGVEIQSRNGDFVGAGDDDDHGAGGKDGDDYDDDHGSDDDHGGNHDDDDHDDDDHDNDDHDDDDHDDDDSDDDDSDDDDSDDDENDDS